MLREREREGPMFSALPHWCRVLIKVVDFLCSFIYFLIAFLCFNNNLVNIFQIQPCNASRKLDSQLWNIFMTSYSFHWVVGTRRSDTQIHKWRQFSCSTDVPQCGHHHSTVDTSWEIWLANAGIKTWPLQAKVAQNINSFLYILYASCPDNSQKCYEEEREQTNKQINKHQIMKPKKTEKKEKFLQAWCVHINSCYSRMNSVKKFNTPFLVTYMCVWVSERGWKCCT